MPTWLNNLYAPPIAPQQQQAPASLMVMPKPVTPQSQVATPPVLESDLAGDRPSSVF